MSLQSFGCPFARHWKTGRPAFLSICPLTTEQGIRWYFQFSRPMYERYFIRWRLGKNLLLCDVDIVNGALVRIHARKTLEKKSNTVRFFWCNRYVYFSSKFNALLETFNSPHVKNSISKLTTWRDISQLANCILKFFSWKRCIISVRQFLTSSTLSIFRKTLTKNFSKTCVFFYSDEIFAEIKEVKGTSSTSWIGNYIPLSNSFSSCFVEEPIVAGYLTDVVQYHVSLTFWKTWLV